MAVNEQLKRLVEQMPDSDNRGMYTENAFWTESAQVLIMVLLGGIHSFVGPIIGATVLYLLQVFTNQYTPYWPTVLGLILLTIVMVLPEGLVGLAKRLGRFRTASNGAQAATPQARPALGSRGAPP